MLLVVARPLAAQLVSVRRGKACVLRYLRAASASIRASRQIVRGEAVIHSSIAHGILRAVRNVRKREADPFAALTERELDVLRALAEGASNSRIAKTLDITENTVKSHVSNVLAKLHLTDRTEAVAFALRQGLLGPDKNK